MSVQTPREPLRHLLVHLPPTEGVVADGEALQAGQAAHEGVQQRVVAGFEHVLRPLLIRIV